MTVVNTGQRLLSADSNTGSLIQQAHQAARQQLLAVKHTDIAEDPSAEKSSPNQIEI